MRAAGVTYGRINIARACPSGADTSFTSAIVLTESGSRFTSNVTVGCDYSKYYTIPSATVPWDFEWYYPQAGAWVRAGWPVPIAEPPPPLHYDAATPVRESAARTVRDTAWGPRRNGGLRCQWYSNPDTACQLEVTLGLGPDWGDWQGRMRAAGFTYGRISLASVCPADASVPEPFVFDLARDTFTGRVTLGCGFGQYYTVPSLDAPWRFEWYSPAQQAWVGGGGQRPLQDALNEALPGLDISQYEQALAGVSLAQLCLPLAFVPGNTDFDSLPDAYKTCEALARSNKYLRRAILVALAAAYGTSLLDELVKEHVPGPTVQEPQPTPTPLPPFPLELPTSGLDEIVQSLLARQPSLTPQQAETLATQCRQLVARAELLSVQQVGGIARHPCATMRIFVPGSDVAAAASHKLDAILGNPSWVQLHNLSADERRNQMRAEGFNPGTWKQQRPECAPGTYDTSSMHCDEYPYFASMESGPHGDPSNPTAWTGFSLRPLSKADNELEGGMYSGFKTRCGLVGEATWGQPFLVVPIPVGFPTTPICNG